MDDDRLLAEDRLRDHLDIAVLVHGQGLVELHGERHAGVDALDLLDDTDPDAGGVEHV
ncbi:MAG: hypothetical protein K1X95_08360 [Acidimicrobiia bacterium]|nr:hypothetical protein [Acidimicrobiia bacterium]